QYCSLKKFTNQKSLNEFIDHTTQSWTEISGVKGLKFSSSNGNSIFLPAAAHLCYDKKDGNGWEVNNEGTGAYWTSTPSTEEDYIYFLEFDTKDGAFFGDREKSDNRLTIRPIYYDPSLSGIDNITEDFGGNIEVSSTDSSIKISTGENSPLEVSLFDLAGQLISQKGTVSGEVLIDGLSSGIYLLKVVHMGKHHSYKILVSQKGNN
ncbi:MAG: T9SS type A sorting domain-containing protein, partial [Muribaculum sp.]|nr:T9SS type A sorting domain-containing protein [Muribaculum sp.]